MPTLDELWGEIKVPNTTLDDGKGYIIDADTGKVKDPVTGQDVTVRAKNRNAPEIARTIGGHIGDASTGFKQGQFGGEQVANAVTQMAQHLGANRPDLVGQKAQGSERQLGDIVNDKGQGVFNESTKAGILPLTAYNPTANERNLRPMRQLELAADKSANRTPEATSLFGEMLRQGLQREVYRPKTLAAKPFANTAQQFVSNPNDYLGIGIRDDNTTTREGYAVSPISQGWDNGLNIVKGQTAGVIDMLADVTSSEYLKRKAYDLNNGIAKDNEYEPAMRTMFDNRGNLKLSNVGQWTDYLTGSLTQSLPSMGVNAAAVLLAAPTYGASFAVPGLLFAGQIYNEQPEDSKDVSNALIFGAGAAAMDIIGDIGAFGRVGKAFKGTHNLATQHGAEYAVQELVKKGLTKEAAELKVANALQNSISNTLKVYSRAIATGVVAEGPTEMAQDALTKIGANGGFNADLNSLNNEQTRWQLAESGITGGILGGGIGALSQTKQELTQRPGNKSNMEPSEEIKSRDRIEKQFGYIPQAKEISDKALEGRNATTQQSLNKMGEVDTERRSKLSLFGVAKDTLQKKGFFGALSSEWGSVFKGDGANMATLRAMAGFGREINRASISEQEELAVQRVLGHFGTEEEIDNLFKGKTKTQVNDIVRSPQAKAYMTEITELLRENIPFQQAIDNANDAELGNYSEYKEQFQTIAKKYFEATKAAEAIGNIKMSAAEVINNRSFNKDEILRDPNQFKDLLIDKLKVTRQQANGIYEAIINGEHINSFDDVMELPETTSDGSFDFLGDLITEDTTGKKEVRKEINSADNQTAFDKYLTKDIYGDVLGLSLRAGRHYVNNNLLGKRGERVAALLEAAEREGEITSEEKYFYAREWKDIIAMREGRYNRIVNPYIKGALNLSSFLVATSMMPLAAISSMVEFSQVLRYLDKNTDNSKKVFIDLTMTMARELATYLRDVGNALTGQKLAPGRFEWEHRKALAAAGLPVGSAHILRRNDIAASRLQRATISFFRLVQLESITNATRFARLALADSAINGWLQQYSAGTDEQKVTAKENLVRIGIDPDFIFRLTERIALAESVGVAKGQQDIDTMQKQLELEMANGRLGFVNEAVLQPTVTNRPKFYNDPYLRIFTALGGYTSVATAKLLPKLYADLTRRGSKFQADAINTVFQIILWSAVAIALKDLIKGDTGDEEKKKKLREKETELYLSRVLNTTGFLGAYQKVFDQFFPVFETNNSIAKQPLGWMWEKGKDLSPHLAYANTVKQAVGAALKEGHNPGETATKIMKPLPGGGAISTFGKLLFGDGDK